MARLQEMTGRLRDATREVPDCGLEQRMQAPSTGLRTAGRHYLLACAHMRRAWLTFTAVGERG